MVPTSHAGPQRGRGARRRFAWTLTLFQERCAEIALLGSRRAPLVNVPGGDVTSEARVALAYRCVEPLIRRLPTRRTHGQA